MKEKYHMFKILVPVTIVASSMPCMANAETKIHATYLSNNVKVGSLGKISADGYGVGIEFRGDTKLSTSIGYSSISEAGLTLSQFSTQLAYDLLNDLDVTAGTGRRLQADIGYATSELKASSTSATVNDDYFIAGLEYELAIAPNLSMGLGVAGILDDFVPTYGVGIGYAVGNGTVSAKYAFNEETIGTTKIEVTGFTIGYSYGF